MTKEELGAIVSEWQKTDRKYDNTFDMLVDFAQYVQNYKYRGIRLKTVRESCSTLALGENINSSMTLTRVNRPFEFAQVEMTDFGHKTRMWVNESQAGDIIDFLQQFVLIQKENENSSL